MTADLKVVHLLDTDQFAGTERYVLTLSEELAQIGVCAYIACLPDSPLCREAQQQNLPTLPILQTGNPLRNARVLAPVLREKGVHLTHAHNGRATLMAALVQRRTGVLAVMTQHFLAPQFTTYRGVKRLAANLAHHWVNRHIAHVIAISDAARAAMMLRESIPASRITTVRNGISPLEEPDAQRCRKLRREWNFADHQPLIVTVARLAAEKGLSCLLQSLVSVGKTHPEARFIVVGEGPMQEQLHREAKSLGVWERVVFTGFRRDAKDIIAAGDIFVLPSLAEPFGLVLLEAMALRKPVIATRAGGPLEIVAEEETGLLVPPDDPNALARAIQQLLSHPTAAATMGQAGRTRFEHHFTARQMAQATRAVYETVKSGK